MPYFYSKTLRVFFSLFIVLTLNFFIPRLMPGDPLIALSGGLDAGFPLGQDLSSLASQYGINKPLTEQYYNYWLGLMHGDWGYSFHLRQPVTQLIASRLPWTLLMLAPAVLLSSLTALLLGSWAGWRAGSKTDVIITLGALFLSAFPPFLPAMLSIQYLSFSWELFPLSGLFSTTPPLSLTDFINYGLDLSWHLALPVLVLSLTTTAGKILVMRNSTAWQSSQEYVTYALAKGLSPLHIVRVHVLRNACLPLVSLIGLQLGYIVSGALVIEIVFSINGMGSLIYDAALYRDYPVLQGCFFILTIFVIVANWLTDCLYGLLDPRINN